jgi:hypothetical protein
MASPSDSHSRPTARSSGTAVHNDGINLDATRRVRKGEQSCSVPGEAILRHPNGSFGYVVSNSNVEPLMLKPDNICHRRVDEAWVGVDPTPCRPISRKPDCSFVVFVDVPLARVVTDSDESRRPDSDCSHVGFA